MSSNQDISEVIMQSVHALNSMDVALFKRLWAPEARWEISAPLNFKFEGTREDISQAFEVGMRKVWRSYFQLAHGTLIEQTSEHTAKAKTYITEQGTKLDGTGQYLVGMYDDELELTQEGWRFTARTFYYLHHEQKTIAGTSAPIGEFLK